MQIINLNHNANKEKKLKIEHLYLNDIYLSIRISNLIPFIKVSF